MKIKDYVTQNKITMSDLARSLGITRQALNYAKNANAVVIDDDEKLSIVYIKTLATKRK